MTDVVWAVFSFGADSGRQLAAANNRVPVSGAVSLGSDK